jgi:hypothetical protein
VSMKEKNPLENEIVLSESLEREIELYAFENSMVSARISAEKKSEEGITSESKRCTTTSSDLGLGDSALRFAKLATTSSPGLEIPHLADLP